MFIPYQPQYTLTARIKRTQILAETVYLALRQKKSRKKFLASVEVTDRCNAGCQFCYVYPPEWDQDQRMKGYLQLPAAERKATENQIIERLETLAKQGIVHVTLVGGEPIFAPKALEKAANLFPIVWIVTNGSRKFPKLPSSSTYFVSFDGTPDYHNQSRDPMGYFKGQKYGSVEGLSAVIARNINESERGAYLHLTLAPQVIHQFPEIVDWAIKDLTKLRGIVVSGTTANSPTAPYAYTPDKRLILKEQIAQAASQYGWHLFPFNKRKTNNFLLNPEHILKTEASCILAREVSSLDFKGDSVGKCIMRDEADCSTCMCNLTAMTRAVKQKDWETIQGVWRSFYG